MREYSIVCPIYRTNPYRKTVKETKEYRVAPNKLNRQLNQWIPSKVLLTDITYLKYRNRKDNTPQ